MRMGTNVFHSRAACANLSSQDVVKYLGNILFALLKKAKYIFNRKNMNKRPFMIISILSGNEIETKTSQSLFFEPSTVPPPHTCCCLQHHEKASSLR